MSKFTECKRQHPEPTGRQHPACPSAGRWSACSNVHAGREEDVQTEEKSDSQSSAGIKRV